MARIRTHNRRRKRAMRRERAPARIISRPAWSGAKTWAEAGTPPEQIIDDLRKLSVSVMDPDGVLHGDGEIIAAANAACVRPQDCAPRMREILFGSPPCR